MICEIGSGYGALARLWMLNPIFIPDVCILLDFPECLFFAENFLKANFKDDKEINIIYLNEEKIDDIDLRAKTIILCPIGKQHLIHSLPIDLVINTGSMQEMTDDWIDYWMQWLDESSVHYFYSFNYCALPIFWRSRECATVYAPRLSKQWHCLLNNIKSPFEPYFQFPRFADILAEKKSLLLDENQLKEKFASIARPLSYQGFLDSLDILRFYPEQELVWRLVSNILSDMPLIPQETYYLVKWLKKNGTDSFLIDKINRLNETEDFLRAFVK